MPSVVLDSLDRLFTPEDSYLGQVSSYSITISGLRALGEPQCRQSLGYLGIQSTYVDNASRHSVHM